MARSLSQMLLSQAQPTAGQGVLTQVQRGISTGLELATLEEQVDQQRNQAAAQRLQLENQKLTFIQKGFNQIQTAGSDAAAKRKAKIFKQAAERAGIPVSDDFLADATERRADISVITKGLAEIQTNPNITPEQKSQITGEALGIIAQDGGFSEAFTSAQGLAQMQARQTAQEETREARAGVQLSRNLVKAQNDFERRVKNERTRLEGISTIKGLLESGGAISQNVAQFQVARLAQGAGVLTKADLEALGGSRAVRNRVESAVSVLTEGKPLTPRDTAELLEIVTLFDTRLNEQLQDKAQSFARGRSKAIGEEPGRILEVLDVAPVPTEQALAEGAQPPEAPQAPTTDVGQLLESLQGVNEATAQAAAQRFLGRPLTPEELQGLTPTQTAAPEPPQPSGIPTLESL